MNIGMLQSYIKQNMPSEVDLTKLSFEHSKDDGIFLDLKNGRYKLAVGKSVSKDQANRVIADIYMDTILGITKEEDRLKNGYSEFATSVNKQKYKLFKPEYVWVDINGVLARDTVIEETKTYCTLKKSGKVEKTSVYGLRPLEIKLEKRDNVNEEEEIK